MTGRPDHARLDEAADLDDPPARLVRSAPIGLTAATTVLRACRVLGAVTVIVLAIVVLTPAVEALAARYAERPRLEPADAIVVLGGGYEAGALSDPSLQRVIRSIELQRRGLAPLLVIAGEAAPVGPSEADVRARLARDLGIPPAAILTVTASTTRDEARRTAALMHPRGVRSVLLVSSSLHLVRARRVFELEGFKVLPAPADQSLTVGSLAGQRLITTRLLARELAAWVYYRLAGYL